MYFYKGLLVVCVHFYKGLLSVYVHFRKGLLLRYVHFYKGLLLRYVHFLQRSFRKKKAARRPGIAPRPCDFLVSGTELYSSHWARVSQQQQKLRSP